MAQINDAGNPTSNAGQAKYITLSSSASRTLTLNESGSIIFMPTNTQAATITLPVASALIAGCNYTFIASGVGAATVYTIRPAANALINKTIISRTLAGGVTTTVATTSAANSITTGTAANFVVGDSCRMVSDGTRWWVYAISGGAGAGWI